MKFCVGDVVECIIQAEFSVFKTPMGRSYTITDVFKDAIKFKDEGFNYYKYAASRFRVVSKDPTYSHLSHKIKQLEDRFKARTHV